MPSCDRLLRIGVVIQCATLGAVLIHAKFLIAHNAAGRGRESTPTGLVENVLMIRVKCSKKN